MKPFIKTLRQARAFVLKSGICGIFSDNKSTMPCLWDLTDLPHRRPGEKGWGQKVIAIWTWKDELPALYPGEIFYGKIPGGLAVLMSFPYLKAHYAGHHVPLRQCSPLAQKIHSLLKLDPMTSAQLRRELGISDKGGKARFDRALLELQVTLNIARRNSLDDKRDTWVPFTEQYLSVS